MRNLTLLVVIALSLSLTACQASKPASGGAQVALMRDAMVEAGRVAEGPQDAAPAVAAVAAHRGSAKSDGASAGVVGALGGGG